jgi:hypothetical protein
VVRLTPRLGEGRPGPPPGSATCWGAGSDHTPVPAGGVLGAWPRSGRPQVGWSCREQPGADEMAVAAVSVAKRSLRAELKQRLRALSAEERLRQSRLLTQKVRRTPGLLECQSARLASRLAPRERARTLGHAHVITGARTHSARARPSNPDPFCAMAGEGLRRVGLRSRAVLMLVYSLRWDYISF